jgi:hypothetical protein
METTCAAFKLKSPIQEIFLSLTIGNKYAVNLAKATPTAAIVGLYHGKETPTV